MKRLRQWFNELQLSLFADDAPTPAASTPADEPSHVPTHKSRSVLLNNITVPYHIERVKRRTVGMIVDHSGLRVRASPRISIGEIESILHSRADWILKHLNKPVLSSPRRSFVPNLQLADGDLLPILGQSVRVEWLDTQQKFTADTWFNDPSVLRLSRVATDKVAQTIVNALADILLMHLNRRADEFAHAHGLRYRTILLSNAKTLWGTCKLDGTLRLNWRLVFLDPALVNYVLAHELAHTREMNHSARFWAVVAELCPDYKKCVREIKRFDLRAC